jgi:hypothetical protein
LRSADLAFSEKKEEGETALGLDGEKVFSPGEAVTQRTERSRLMLDPMLVVYC